MAGTVARVINFSRHRQGGPLNRVLRGVRTAGGVCDAQPVVTHSAVSVDGCHHQGSEIRPGSLLGFAATYPIRIGASPAVHSQSYDRLENRGTKSSGPLVNGTHY